MKSWSTFVSFSFSLFEIFPASKVSFHCYRISFNHRYFGFFQRHASVADLNSTVRIEALNKVFKTKDGLVVNAVSDVFMTMYPGEIFALLGHNGAGKTTTMSMLTGFLQQDSGRIEAFGMQIPQELSALRRSMGVCPQHNALWDELTVLQHMRIFGMIRGGGSTADDEAQRTLIAEVGLTAKTNFKSRALSGGMKRRLSVALALLGEPALVVLDEPTSGMDPYARRAMWELLKKKKQNRIICLTTHYMDEADVLGDRIAIMAKGKVQCCGSSVFLKNRYGCGYILSLAKVNHKQADQPILDLVSSNLVGADVNVMSSSGRELLLQVPFKAAQGPAFGKLLSELDNEAVRKSLGLITYGVSVTNLEEVFIKVASGTEPNPMDSKIKLVDSEKDVQQKTDADKKMAQNQSQKLNAEGHIVFKVATFRQQFFALLERRVWIGLRDRRMLFCQFILPLVLVFTFLLLSMAAIGKNLPPLKLGMNLMNAPSREDGIKPLNPLVINMASNMTSGVRSTLTTEWTSFCGGSNPDYCDKALFTGSTSAREFELLLLSGATSPKSSQTSSIYGAFSYLTPQNLQANVGGLMNKLGALKLDRSISAMIGNAKALESYFKDVKTYLGLDLNTIFDVKRLSAGTYTTAELGVLVPQASTAIQNALQTKVSELGAERLAAEAGHQEGDFQVWVNQTGYHSDAIMAANHFVKWQRSRGTGITGLEITNHPFGLTDYDRGWITVLDGMIAVIAIIIGAAFIPAGIITFIVFEKGSAVDSGNVKEQLLVSGCGVVPYWLSNFVFDYLAFIPAALGIVILLYAFDIKSLVDSDKIGATLVLHVTFGTSCIAFCYLISSFFKNAYVAQMVVIILCLVLTFVGVLLVFVLRLIPDSYCSLCRPIANIVRWILRFIPNYSFGEGMYAMTFQVEIFNVPPFAGETFGECYTAGLFFLKLCWGGVADQVVMMTILTFLYMAGIIGYDLAMQVPKVRAWFTVKKPVAVTELALEDDDVVAEQRRVKEIEGEKAHQILWVRNLRKAYSRSVFGRFSKAEPFHAVKDVSFAASEGQVFGLLGVNGAGKTTTFKMLCAEYTPSGGDVWIQGHSVIEEPGVCRKMIGYCPQFDAIWDLLTVQEHLTLYAKLKGISRRNVKEAVNEKITELDLERYRNARAGSLSGGNKRKLSVAMALMGEPPMVFLDEPSSGMDPMARRFMWDVVQRIAERRKKSVVILSTHSMEEAEALCSRIAIQVDGQFRCLGSSQQIKTRYGDGFEAVIKFKTISSEEVAKVLAGWAVGERLTLSKTMEVIDDKIEPVSIKPGRNYSRKKKLLKKRFLHSNLISRNRKDCLFSIKPKKPR